MSTRGRGNFDPSLEMLFYLVADDVFHYRRWVLSRDILSLNDKFDSPSSRTFSKLLYKRELGGSKMNGRDEKNREMGHRATKN